MRNLLLVESFDLCPSNQYILVRVIPSCFRFAKMCLVQPEILDIFFLGELHIVYMDWGAHSSSCGECCTDRPESVSSYSPF
jgi:hypothetical protein